MPPIDSRRSRALLALVVLALVWGYNWVVMKAAVRDASPFVFAAWRTLGGAAALFTIAIATRRKLRPEYPLAYLWIGVFQTAAFVGLVTWAVVSAGAGQVAMLAYTMPLWVSVLAAPFLGERLRAPHVVAIVIALAGVLCMMGFTRAFGLAEMLALLAGFGWAVGVIIAKRVAKHGTFDVFGMTMWQMLAGGIVLTIVALVVPGRATEWTTPYIVAVAYNILLATALAYLLWIFILDVLPAREASMGTLANPIVGVFAAWVQLGEAPTLLSGIGMVLIVAGLVVLALADRPLKRPSNLRYD